MTTCTKFSIVSIITCVLKFDVWRHAGFEDQSKTCPVKFASTGTCSGPFGISECYHEAMGKYGNIPPKGCKCIPNGVNSRFCLCNIIC